MKRFLTLLTIIMFLVLPAKLNGEPIPEDMTVFKIAILLQHCDQSDEIKVVRLRNTLTGKDAFCLQPHVNYKPNVNEYFKIADDTKALYDLYQAYEQFEKTEEASATSTNAQPAVIITPTPVENPIIPTSGEGMTQYNQDLTDEDSIDERED